MKWRRLNSIQNSSNEHLLSSQYGLYKPAGFLSSSTSVNYHGPSTLWQEFKTTSVNEAIALLPENCACFRSFDKYTAPSPPLYSGSD